MLNDTNLMLTPRMSGEGSPSLLNLRDFRIQRKPALTHNISSSSSPESSLNTANMSKKNYGRILDSDSEIEINGVPTPLKIKTVILSPQETDGHAPALKSPSTTNSSNETKSSPKEIKPDNKKTQIQAREKMVRYLIYSFPTAQSFEIYEFLSKTKFNLDETITILQQKKHAQTEDCLPFDVWAKRETPIEKSPCAPQTQQRTSNLQRTIEIQKINLQKINDSNITSAKRKEVSPGQAVVRKVKKRKILDDDSDDEGGHTYRENRVYDSEDDSDAEIDNVLTADKKRVLEFFQTATPNELQLMPTCSKKKIDAIISLRPFNNWVDLVQKLQENKNLSTELLNYGQRVITNRNNVKQLMKKCSSISQQLQQAVNSGAQLKTEPALLNPDMKLTSYQIVGLNWLSVLHKEGVNGILADEMGLGKTVQVISFLAHLKEINAAKNTHLVVVPSSTLENWQNEFERWCPDLKVLLYYGSTEERRSFRILFAQGEHKEYDVILTTYTMVNSGPEERKMFRVTPMHYVIFDEAHMLKNMNTQRYESLVRIRAANRILLTGTPLQNNLLELMSLLIFVMPHMFSEKTDDLKNLFQKTSRNNKDDEDLPAFEREQIEQAKKIMKPFLLRRLKRDVLQDLPKKEDYMLEIPMASSQKEKYMNLVATFKAAGANNEPGYSGVTMMSDLRKLCNHPCLLRYYYQQNVIKTMAKRLAKDPNYKDTVEKYIIDDLLYMSDFEIHTLTKEFNCLKEFALPDDLIFTSGKFIHMNKQLDELKKNGHRVLIFSQYVIMLNVMEEYLKLKNHSYLRLDGSTPVNIRQQLIDEYTEDPTIFIFLLSTKAGGLGINLTAADTVIIHDIDFNPYNDKQAEDRCHRMGQTRPVSVYRFISKGSIEQGMWQLTQEKLKLEKEITNDVNETTDIKSVVSLLSSALGIGQDVATNLVSPKKM